jgi:hypothetical protein
VSGKWHDGEQHSSLNDNRFKNCKKHFMASILLRV